MERRGAQRKNLIENREICAKKEEIWDSVTLQRRTWEHA
jgi:hypothetical protein